MIFVFLILATFCAAADPKEKDATYKGKQFITQTTGRTVDNNQFSMTSGERGPVLLQDFTLLDKLGHLDTERIPERVVHAKGAGAHGVFQVTNDISKYSKAKLFSNVGKKTPVFVRLSTVVGGIDSPDTVRDPRGFAIKFYTEDGNWDMVGLSLPVFFIRDGIKFPDFAHSQKKDPQLELSDPNIPWDFLSLTPESIHVISMLFSDRGIPDGFRHMDGFSTNTYQMVNAEGQRFFVKIHLKTRQGIRSLSPKKAARLQVEDSDYSRRDLYDAIGRKKYPSWDFYIQALSVEEAENFPYDVLDPTKVWPHKLAPLIPVGRLTLNGKPDNFFAEVEQVGFSPSHLVPGIEPSFDKLLQGRLFSYSDTQRHRLGSNAHQIPINCPYRSIINDDTGIDYVVRDGFMTVDGNNGDRPNYEPNTMGPFNANAYQEREEDTSPVYVVGPVGRFPYNHPNSDFEQARDLYRNVFDDGERQRLVENLVGALTPVRKDIKKRMIRLFTKVDNSFGSRIAAGLHLY